MEEPRTCEQRSAPGPRGAPQRRALPASRPSSDRLRNPLRELLAQLLRLLKRGLLLLEVLLQKGNDIFFAHRLGRRDQALVDRDLVMLGLRHSGDDYLVVEAVIDELQICLPLLLEPFDRRTRRIVHLCPQSLECALEIRDMPA